MKRNKATSLFAHLKKDRRESHEEDDGKNSSSTRRESGGKHAASPSVSKNKVVPPGQKSITSFFMKPKREREDTQSDVGDVGECTTVLSEKRRRLDAEEDQDLPATFSQWDKAWDEGTSGLDWNKTPGTPGKGEKEDGETEDAEQCDEHRAKSDHLGEDGADETEISARKSLLVHLNEDEGETGGEKKVDVNDWLKSKARAPPESGTRTSSEETNGAKTPARDQHREKTEHAAEDGRAARQKSLLLQLDDEEKETTSGENPPEKVQPAFPKYITDRTHTQKAQTKMFGAFSASAKPRPAEDTRREEEKSSREEKSREEQASRQQAEASALRGAAGKLPAAYRDAWDDFHVRLPCSPRNVSSGASRWDTVRQALWPPSKLENFSSLRRAILSYMSGASAVRRGENGWEFLNLKRVLEEDMDAVERKTFFWSTLPHMVRLALALPTVCSEPIPLLRAGAAKSVELSSLQAASLLANAFFCAFPAAAAREQRGRFPYINFTSLFESEKGAEQGPKKFEKRSKLRCLLHYFDRQARRLDGDGGEPDDARYGWKLRERKMTFSRRVLPENLRWEESSASFEGVRLRVQPSGTIEDHDRSGRAWQADFANCMIGGGVLGRGAVQEEIRFVISPELIVSRLLAEELGPRESVLMVGTERFCNYSGYAASFRFAGDHVDEADLDSDGRLMTAVTAMDAIFFYRNEYLHQFRAESLRRELNKALVSFVPERDPRLQHAPDAPSSSDDDDAAAPTQARVGAVATGNWGCGVFGGDPFLKAVIQMMAAAEAGRSLVYLTFGDQKLSLQLEELYRVLVSTGRAVRDLFAALNDFRPHPVWSQLCAASGVSLHVCTCAAAHTRGWGNQDSKAPAGAGQDLRLFLLKRFEVPDDSAEERDTRDERESTP